MNTRIFQTLSYAFIFLISANANADVIVLTSGSEIHGEIIKRTDNKIWVDIGPELITINMSLVESVEIDDSNATTQSVEIDTANLV